MSLVGWVFSGSLGFSSAPAYRRLNFSSTLAPATGAQFRASCWWGPSRWWGVLASSPRLSCVLSCLLDLLGDPTSLTQQTPEGRGVSPLSPLPCSFCGLFFVVLTFLTPKVWVFHSESFSSSLQTPIGSIQSWYQLPSLMTQMVKNLPATRRPRFDP